MRLSFKVAREKGFSISISSFVTGPSLPSVALEHGQWLILLAPAGKLFPLPSEVASSEFKSLEMK